MIKLFYISVSFVPVLIVVVVAAFFYKIVLSVFYFHIIHFIYSMKIINREVKNIFFVSHAIWVDRLIFKRLNHSKSLTKLLSKFLLRPIYNSNANIHMHVRCQYYTAYRLIRVSTLNTLQTYSLLRMIRETWLTIQPMHGCGGIKI